MSNANKIQTKDYQQTLTIVQDALIRISKNHGALKRWSVDNDLNYNTVIRIKNGNLGYVAPHLLKRLLEGTRVYSKANQELP